jgi:hypothetical protein
MTLKDGNVGIGTTAPDKSLEINKSTGGELRLTYNDSNGSATDYTDFVTDANGGLTLTTVDSDGAAGDITLSPDGLVDVTTDFLFVGSGSGLPYGQISYHDSGANIVMAAQDTWYQFTGFDTDGDENLTDADHTNDHIIIQKTGIYRVSIAVSAKSATANDFEISVFKNNGTTQCDCADIHFTTVAGAKVVPSAVSAILPFTANDTIEVWAQRTDGLGVSKTLILEHCTLSLNMIGG